MTKRNLFGSMRFIILSNNYILLFSFLFISCGDNLDRSEESLINSHNDPTHLPDNIESLAVNTKQFKDVEGVTFLKNSSVPYSGYAIEVTRGRKNVLLLDDGWVIRHVGFFANGLKERDSFYTPKSVSMRKYSFPNQINQFLDRSHTQWYRNGFKKYQIHYIEGTNHGSNTSWYVNGSKKEESFYSDGVTNGPASKWYENGQKSLEYFLQAGRYDKNFTSWYPSGEKRSFGQFKEMKRHGEWNVLYKNGTNQLIRKYYEGELIERTRWDALGKRIEEPRMDLGTVEIYNPFQREQILKNAVDHEKLTVFQGIPREFIFEGKPFSGWVKDDRYNLIIWRVQNGYQNGPHYQLRINSSGSNKWLEANFRDGEFDGELIQFDKEEKIESREFYFRGNSLSRGEIISNALPYENFEFREGLAYLRGKPVPYSGYFKVKKLPQDVFCKINMGFMEMTISWHKNGMLSEVKHYRSTNLEQDKGFDFEKIKKFYHGLDLSWYDSGQKKSEAMWFKGKPLGRHVSWYDDGIESSEMYYNLDGTKKAMRCDPKKRVERLKSGGGKLFTGEAIVKGLQWLQEIQDEDGGWGEKDWDHRGKLMKSDRIAMTSMALLTYLGHCELHVSPDFGSTVKKAIDFLSSASFESKKGYKELPFSHAIFAEALCEAYIMTKIPKLLIPAKAEVQKLIETQNQDGGWSSNLTKQKLQESDILITAWSVNALLAAYQTSVPLEGLEKCLDKAMEYIKSCQGELGFFDSKQFLGIQTSCGIWPLLRWEKARSDQSDKGLEWIIASKANNWSNVDAMEWYFQANACFYSTGYGTSKYWREWNKKFQNIVCDTQNKDGSWPSGKLFIGESKIFRTTLSILMLEVYYRYAPMRKI